MNPSPAPSPARTGTQTAGDERERTAVVAAQQLAGLVHDYDPQAVADWLEARSRDDLQAACVALAAMVDVTQPPSVLLAWLSPDRLPSRAPWPVKKPCGTRAAYERGCRCVPCVVAARAYYRQSKRRKREAA